VLELTKSLNQLMYSIWYDAVTLLILSDANKTFFTSKNLCTASKVSVHWCHSPINNFRQRIYDRRDNVCNTNI